MERVDKFIKKISGQSRKERIDRQKSVMISKETFHTPKLVKIEIEIKKIVNGEPVSLLPYYIIFGKEIYRRQNMMKFKTLVNEVQELEQKWLKRGLNPFLLNSIKLKYLGGFEVWKAFELDISDLDGVNVLG